VLLAALAAEAAQNTKDRSDPPLVDVEHAWSAAERVVLEMVASEVDRKVDLSARYSPPKTTRSCGSSCRGSCGYRL